MALRDDALRLAGKGLSVLPIEKGTKKFKGISWKEYQSRLMSESEIATMFIEGDALAIVCGEVSKNLELIDFDIPGKHEIIEGKKGVPPSWRPFLTICKDHGYESLVKRLLLIETKSGGMHVLYRCPSGIEGNQKLAREDESKEVLIETRGEGGYFLTYPTPGYTIKQGSFDSIPEITAEEREFLLTAGRMLNEVYEEHQTGHKVNGPGLRPGDDYNQRATWEDLLEKHGWTKAGKSSGNRTGWVRPGKSKKDGISATTGNGPTDLLFVHSTNAHPFEADKSYSKFGAFTVLEHSGDYHFATSALSGLGYGKKETKKPGPDSFHEIQGDDTFASTTLEDVEAESPDWLWDPYLMRRHLNLLDAKGSSGKTTLIIATALQMSQGKLPFGGECEPLTTLYFGCEDTPGEVKFLAQKLGGDFNKFVHVSDPLIRLDDAGLSKVYRTIKKHNAGLVVFDAITYYFAGMVRDPYNGMEIAPHLNKLRDVAREANCAIWNVRHFAKYSKGKDIEEMGAGAEQWRNSHRRQLVLRPHPEIPRYGIVCPARGSLNAGKGEAFAFSMQDDIFGWINNPDLSVFDQDKERGEPPLKKLEQAKAFITTLCQGQFVLSSRVWEQAKAAYITESTLKRASGEMKEAGLLEFKRWDKDGPWHWHVPMEVDPFESA